MSTARDLAYALDAAAFSREAAGIEPDVWQEQVLRSTAPRLLLNASRQSGKSTTVATLAVWTALYEPGALVLLLSPTLRQSGELMRKCLEVYGASGRTVDSAAESKLSLELSNGARIISLPGNEGTIRGYSSVRLLCVDEASRVPDELMAAVRPMLAVSHGRLVALSTPFGTRGWWYEAWRSSDAWARWEVPASACPRIEAAFLEEERRTLGEFWFDQEYGCQFLDSQSSAFRSADIERMFSDDIAEWDFGPSPAVPASAPVAGVTPPTPAAPTFSAYQQPQQQPRTALDDELEEMERQRERMNAVWYGGLGPS